VFGSDFGVRSDVNVIFHEKIIAHRKFWLGDAIRTRVFWNRADMWRVCGAEIVRTWGAAVLRPYKIGDEPSRDGWG